MSTNSGPLHCFPHRIPPGLKSRAERARHLRAGARSAADRGPCPAHGPALREASGAGQSTRPSWPSCRAVRTARRPAPRPRRLRGARALPPLRTRRRRGQARKAHTLAPPRRPRPRRQSTRGARGPSRVSSAAGTCGDDQRATTERARRAHATSGELSCYVDRKRSANGTWWPMETVRRAERWPLDLRVAGKVRAGP